MPRASAPTWCSTGRRSTSSRWRQRDQLRMVFEALDEDARVRVIVLRAAGEHFSSGGNIAGFLAASPEHVSKLAWNIAAPARCSKPVIAASRGYCFGVGFEISLACDFRHCLRNLPIRAAGAAARPNPRLRRLRAPAKDHRHHAHQGHRDALQTHPGEAGLRMGHRHRMRARRTSSKRRPTRWSTNCARSRRSRSAPPRRCSTKPKTPTWKPPSSWKAIATAGCASPTISARASRRFTPNASRCFAAADSLTIEIQGNQRMNGTPFKLGTFAKPGGKPFAAHRAGR